MAERQLTADKKVQINRLVEIIEDFLPISTYGKSANTFESRVCSEKYKTDLTMSKSRMSCWRDGKISAR